MTTYGRFLWHWNGAGCRVWDTEGREYLTLWLGLRLALWDAHPALVETVTRQIQTLHHVSNLFYIPVQGQLAKWLIEHSVLSGYSSATLELKRTKERLNWRGSTLKVYKSNNQ